MATTDPSRGRVRHALTVAPGAARGSDGEGEQIRIGVTALEVRVWGCTHVTPVAGGAASEVAGDV